MKTNTRIETIHPQRPQPDVIRQAADVIRAGGVVAFPTRGLYGLAADAFNAAAVERVFDIKQRPRQKPLLVMINHKKQLDRLVKRISSTAAVLMDHCWPGGVTLVFEARDDLPDNLTAATGKIGVRLPGHPVAMALATALENPITGTSANLSGCAGCHRVEDMDPSVADQLDLILDAGRLKGGKGSTIIDVSQDFLQILREGHVSAEEILSLFP